MKVNESNVNTNIYKYFEIETLKNDSILNNKPAVIYRHKTLTFKQLKQFIDKFKFKIYTTKNLTNTTNSSSIIGVSLIPDEYTIGILLSIHSIGKAYLPIDPFMPIKRIEFIINDSKVNFIITHSSYNQ